MNERDQRAVRAGPRDVVDQPDAARFQAFQRGGDIVDAERDVVKPGTPLRRGLAIGIAGRRLQEFERRSPAAMKWARTRWEATSSGARPRGQARPDRTSRPRRCRRRRSRCDPGPGRPGRPDAVDCSRARRNVSSAAHGSSSRSPMRSSTADSAVESSTDSSTCCTNLEDSSSRPGTRPAHAAGAAGWRRPNGPGTRDRIEERMPLPRRGLGLHDRRTPLPLLKLCSPSIA